MLAHIKPRLLTALAILLTAPLAPAQTPTNLHDCQAYTHAMAHVYAYALACKKPADKTLDKLLQTALDQDQATTAACTQLGMTREMRTQWLDDEKQLIARQVLQKYGLFASEPRYIGDRQIAEHCQSELPRLKKMLQPLIP
jgi:hypothetical protein